MPQSTPGTIHRRAASRHCSVLLLTARQTTIAATYAPHTHSVSSMFPTITPTSP